MFLPGNAPGVHDMTWRDGRDGRWPHIYLPYLLKLYLQHRYTYMEYVLLTALRWPKRYKPEAPDWYIIFRGRVGCWSKTLFVWIPLVYVCVYAGMLVRRRRVIFFSFHAFWSPSFACILVDPIPISSYYYYCIYSSDKLSEGSPIVGLFPYLHTPNLPIG